MFCGRLLSPEVRPLGPQETAGEALRQMEALGLHHLPVCRENDLFEGIVSADELFDLPESSGLSALAGRSPRVSVKPGDTFLSAVRLTRLHGLDMVPVVNERDECEGVVTLEALYRELADLTGATAPGAQVVLDMDPVAYSLGEINRIVESNDAYITHLNTLPHPSGGRLTVFLRINREEVSDIVASFQRHEYSVVHYSGEEHYRNELQTNLEHLLNYLGI